MTPSMTRRQFGSVLAGSLGAAAVARAQSRPPNVLLLMADDLRGDTLGYMGHPVVKTPTLDALARGGVALRRCFTASPAGVPARVSVLTGRYPKTHGVTSEESPLDAGEVSLPELFAKKGYRTGVIGNVEIPGRKLEDLFAHRQTFDGYLAMLNEKFPDLKGNPDALANRMEGQGGLPWSSGATLLRPEDCPAGWAAAKTIEFAEAAKADEPWFLFTSFRKGEDAFVAPFPWPTRYPAEQIAIPRLPEERPTPPTKEDRDADYITSNHSTTLSLLRQAYFGGISFLDEQIGKVVQSLRSLGQLENTLIVFTSDHGNMLGQLGRMGCTTPYDGAAHVPCMFHYEAGFEITGGVDRVTDTTCLAPTVLELSGMDVPEGFETPSAKRILTVVDADWDDVAFSELGFRAIRTAQWKLVEPREHPSWEPQLFDLENDPFERVNLYGKPDAAKPQAELAVRLQEWEQAKPKAVQA